MPRRPLFITFEGPEGSGKSTQLKLLAERLRAQGRSVVETREPGGTEIGMQIRKVLLNPANHTLAAPTELLLMFASRAQNVSELIRPALDQGSIVLCDRFTDSTHAYQGGGRGCDPAIIQSLNQVATAGLSPDFTILLDIDTQQGLARAHARNQTSNLSESRFDDEQVSFHQRVRAAFLDLAAKHPQRISVVSGVGTIDQVSARIWEAITPVLA